MSASREKDLQEWVDTLPKNHRVHSDLAALRAQLAEAEAKCATLHRYVMDWQAGTHDFACESELDDATKCMTPCGCADRRKRLTEAEARLARLRPVVRWAMGREYEWPGGAWKWLTVEDQAWALGSEQEGRSDG